jgi:sulfite reductase (NADPH) hemoprotein beta-component
MTNDTPTPAPGVALTEVERIKAAGRHLRGTIAEGLEDPLTSGIGADDQTLIKFHGIYQQDDRDIRERRRRRKLEAAFSFMVRVRLPGGRCRPDQWLQLDECARAYGGGAIRLTTRQAVQFHGVRKQDLRGLVCALDRVGLDTLAACGDVNRNVMCTPFSGVSAVHTAVHAQAVALSRELTPRTAAYREIWIDGKRVREGAADEEPLYGPTYLPRKFKIALAIPPENDVDVFAHDLGFIAIEEDGALAGFNITVGGGMGMTHGLPSTYPQLGRLIGFCRPEEAVEVARGVVTIQRDHGDRTDRRHARLKYTIDDRGLEWLAGELAARLGRPLAPAKPFRFERTGDRYGWRQGPDGRWFVTLFIENGRLRADGAAIEGLRELAGVMKGEFRLTPNQNVMIAGVASEEKAETEAILTRHGLDAGREVSALRRNAMACVALPTCPLAMAESERYLPSLVTKLEEELREAGLAEDEITIRMTGCPNGCARPYLAEIGLVGKGPGTYNLYLGASFAGDRLNQLHRENIGEAEILRDLSGLFRRYAAERTAGERFGDFAVRAGLVAAVTDGRAFHRPPPAAAGSGGG